MKEEKNQDLSSGVGVRSRALFAISSYLGEVSHSPRRLTIVQRLGTRVDGIEIVKVPGDHHLPTLISTCISLLQLL